MEEKKIPWLATNSIQDTFNELEERAIMLLENSEPFGEEWKYRSGNLEAIQNEFYGSNES